MNEIMDEQINLMKEQMKQVIDYMQHDNHENYFMVLTTQYDALRKLFEIDSLKVEVGLNDVLEPQGTPQDAVEGVEVENIPIEQDNDSNTVCDAVIDTDDVLDDTRPMYRVERKLRGAYISEIEAYIPETVLRNQNIQHGDYVYADYVDTKPNGQKQFNYELARKAYDGEPEGRVEYTYCSVEKDTYLYVVNRSLITGESIRIDGVPFTVVIDDSDLDRFDISEGDLVDVAFYENNPDSARVIWKHDICDGSIMEKVEPIKRNERRSKEEDTDTDIEQVFEGYTVCIVGDKPNEVSYKTLIEERGGSHLHVEPTWIPSRIETMVKKADVVVGLYDVSSHTGLEKAKEYCKEYNVPFEMISGRGKTKTIQTAIDLLHDTAVSS